MPTLTVYKYNVFDTCLILINIVHNKKMTFDYLNLCN